MKTLANYVNGLMVAPLAGKYLDNVEPATGTAYSKVPDSDASDLAAAVAAAKQAFPSWAATSLDERSRLLLAVADLIDENLETLARAESVDNGKPVSLARRVDVPRASANFRFFAHAVTQFSSEAHVMPDGTFNYTVRDPIGIVGCISPWNLPIYLFSWKIAPAIAAGNCVIAKPSELTPMTAHMLAEICGEAGLPPGVLNILHGRGAGIGAAICAHPDVKAVSFTGGTKTGAEIARTAAPMFKKLSLELGGKNPTIVFSDCNFEETVESVLRAAFSNQGEICLCGSRILVERPLYARFRDELVRRTKNLKVGDPLEEGTDQGALVSEQHMEKVLSYIELALQEGGRVLAGGERVTVAGRCENGYFVAPTLVEGLAQACRTNREEVFGPFATLLPFDSDEEALAIANDTEYGLAASVWTENLTRAHRVARELDAGIVWVNTWLLRDLRTPFGGMKSSGVGREGGFEALRFFTESKNVCVRLGTRV
jgi:aminomuconate-semialdehyde/2-hydroxymuconate-6-semialdehyde dehydrogenase